jgi:colicin import membrane protein
MRAGLFAVRCGIHEGAFPLKKQFPHGIDITAPGGLTALMAFHRKTFGDAVMETDPAFAPDVPAVVPPAATPVVPDESQLGDAGKAALQVERDARAAEKARADAAEAKLQAAEDAKLSDIQKAQKERDDQASENAKLKAANARLAALADYPVPKEYQDLVTGTDEASYLASAKKISDLYARAEGKAPKPDPVHKSGTRNGDKPAGGSLAAGRELYESKHKKTTSEKG